MPATNTQQKNVTSADASFGAVPRPKYEVPLEERTETLNDSHSRSSDAESPYLTDFIPGTARG
jgi:hypothetical protein